MAGGLGSFLLLLSKDSGPAAVPARVQALSTTPRNNGGHVPIAVAQPAGSPRKKGAAGLGAALTLVQATPKKVAPVLIAVSTDTPVTPATGYLAATLDTLSLSATGAAPEVASLTSTLDTLSLSATGAAPEVASLTSTLDTLSLTATGAAPEVASLINTLNTLSLTATGAAPEVASLISTLNTLSLSAAGSVRETASLVSLLDTLSLTATGVEPEVGSLTSTLDTLSLSATCAVRSTLITSVRATDAPASRISPLHLAASIQVQDLLDARVGVILE